MKSKNIPTTKQIKEFLAKNGPANMTTIAEHFNCLTKPTPNSRIRGAVWRAVSEGVAVDNFLFGAIKKRKKAKL